MSPFQIFDVRILAQSHRVHNTIHFHIKNCENILLKNIYSNFQKHDVSTLSDVVIKSWPKQACAAEPGMVLRV